MATDAQLDDVPLDEHAHWRQKIESAFMSVRGFITASARGLPTDTGDGSYLMEEHHTGLLKDLSSLGFRDMLALSEMVKQGAEHKPIKDDDYLLEKVIKAASDFPPHSRKLHALSNGFIEMLWHDLEHPPISYLGEQFQYRMADGSHNNIKWPQLGAANTPYARSVAPRTGRDQALPDPGVIFDSLFARDGFQPHPNKISSVLFYLASIIIHDCFKTDPKNSNNTTTSSYLDLAPLYGSNQAEQDEMRTKEDGMLKQDCFSDKRILGFPPGVGVLLVLFNRFHNYIADNLAQINEAGRFDKPDSKKNMKTWEQYDNDLFQTARLITCGLYVNMILKDYVRVILNLHRTDSVWDLDPRTKQGASMLGTPAGVGTGNQVSAEFNLVYRWHAAVSERDQAWTEEQYRKLFPDKEPHEVDWHELVVTLGKWESELPQDPQKREFGDIARDENGKLDDDKLAEILYDSIEDVAGAFGANHVPKVFRSIEILGIMQARKWNLASLNEFREFFNLKKHKEFTDINPDPHVAQQLKHLYDTPDKVELYPGLVAEAAKKPQIGSGLCPGFTVSRSILSDAVSLVRGDRFYTVDYTPKNLTSWGYKTADYDDGFDQGHVFYKLILRGLPNHFKHNSVYAHFPMTEPKEMEGILNHLKMGREYDFERPTFTPPMVMIKSYDAAKHVLSDKHTFGITWGDAVEYLMQKDGKKYGQDFMLSGDKPMNSRSRQLMQGALYKDGWKKHVTEFYERMTTELLEERHYKLAGEREVDIVRDVGNLVQVHFSAEVFNLPLKTRNNPHNPFAEQELYAIMALVFTTIFFADQDPATEMQLRQVSRTLTQELGEILESRIRPVGHGTFEWIMDQFARHHKQNPLSAYGTHMIVKLLEANPQLSVKDMIYSHILGTAGGMVAIQGQLFGQVLDFYLRPENKKHWDRIQSLARLDTGSADEEILKYFMEGARLNSSVALPRELCKDATVQDGDRTLHLKKGQRVIVNLVAANRDAAWYDNVDEVDPDRNISDYIVYGWGPHTCLGMEMSQVALSTMLKTVAKLDGLRRAPGAEGELKQMHNKDGFATYMTKDGTQIFPFPTSMKVRWNGQVRGVKRKHRHDDDDDE